MKLKYRTRLTAVAAVSSGIVIALIFTALVTLVARSERASLARDLRLGLDQAVSEMREKPRNPDLDEVIAGYPGLSIALFDQGGTRLEAKGPEPLKLEDPPLSGFAEMRQIVGDRVVEVGISSRPSEARIRKLSVLAAAFWLPLTGIFTLAIWITAKSTFSPLTAMTAQAAKLDDHQLSFRLPMIYGGEYDQFTGELNALLDRIQAGVERQEQFAFDAAHELRTPLTIISGTLQEGLRGKNPEDPDVPLYRQLLAETDRLSALVNMLLESARSKTCLAHSAADVGTCLESSGARWLDRYTERSVRLLVEATDSVALISPSELETVLDNLLSNALRASSSEMTVTLSNSVAHEFGVIVLEDEGGGIPADRSDAVFAPFVRLDSGRNRQQGGFGLGLAICKRLIEDRGGSISVGSSSAGGAKFTIQIPARNAEP